ncbi:uncharacterized protein IWZ02DRAFT_428860 [Phyllosticta citriasiana]|uniref:uncharacterized protein n=1 Tax=Phyllosticta citriasiana TaxID=595635 RepID=UPI0030FDB854
MSDYLAGRQCSGSGSASASGSAAPSPEARLVHHHNNFLVRYLSADMCGENASAKAIMNSRQSHCMRCDSPSSSATHGNDPPARQILVHDELSMRDDGSPECRQPDLALRLFATRSRRNQNPMSPRLFFNPGDDHPPNTHHSQTTSLGCSWKAWAVAMGPSMDGRAAAHLNVSSQCERVMVMMFVDVPWQVSLYCSPSPFPWLRSRRDG